MNNINDTQIIIMAGGIGSRFWPMSTPDYPKQFIDVMGVGRSLIQLTVDRLKTICPVENMWVVTNEKCRNLRMEHRYHQQGNPYLPTEPCQQHG